MGFTLHTCQSCAGALGFGTASENVVLGDNHGWPGKWTAGPGNPVGAPAQDNGMPVYGGQATGSENQAAIAGFGYEQWRAGCHK